MSREMPHAEQVGDPRTVARALDEIALLLTLSGENRYKVQAYERGARVVTGLGQRLGTWVEEGRLGELEGVGAGLAKQITELWRTGHSELLTRLRSEHPPGAAELARIEGMTAKRIRALHDALGITTAEALREACASQRVRGLSGFGAKVEERLLTAVERWLSSEGVAKRILLADAHVIAARLERQLVAPGHATAVELAGAARRGEETLTELELVVEGERAQVLEVVSRLPEVAELDEQRDVAALVEGISVRLHVTDRERKAAQLWLATGSEQHVRGLCERAEARGLELTRDGIRGPGGVMARIADEREIYGAVELAYVPPELRVGGDELELAQHEAFDDVVQLSDLRGMVHCHTTHSDGKNTIEEMARAAEQMGMQYITITDHSPSAHYAGGVTLDRLARQWDEIAEAQERVRIRILRGTESDILEDGSLDYPDAVLEKLDVVIASIHSRLRLGREEMTRRLVRAMSLPIFKIWGHALGRLLLERDPIDCDVPRVLEALAGSRGAVEINGDPHRLDLPPTWLPLARAQGIPFVISADAHSVPGLYAIQYGVTMARRGGLRRGDVLNTLSADAFAARVRPT